MKTYGGAEVLSHSFVMWALDGGQWCALTASHFTPLEEDGILTKLTNSAWVFGAEWLMFTITKWYSCMC